ncbi:thiamine-binding protein [Caldanaerobacter sp.]|uniref:thiamine-binding protein n=1 Tax=Caldanaerobacter sp. TaxID=2930036 RepID=UPI003C7878B9
MPVVNLSLQVLPLVPEEKAYRIIDKVIKYIRSTGVNFMVGPMETTMEGELDDLLDIVKEAQNICEKEGANRVISIIKLDYRSSGVTMEEKIKNYIDK